MAAANSRTSLFNSTAASGGSSPKAALLWLDKETRKQTKEAAMGEAYGNGNNNACLCSPSTHPGCRYHQKPKPFASLWPTKPGVDLPLPPNFHCANAKQRELSRFSRAALAPAGSE